MENDLEDQASTFDYNHYWAVKKGNDPLDRAIEKELRKFPGYEKI